MAFIIRGAPSKVDVLSSSSWQAQSEPARPTDSRDKSMVERLPRRAYERCLGQTLREAGAVQPASAAALGKASYSTATKRADRALAALAKRIVILPNLRAVNAQQEREKFFAAKGQYEPKFVYPKLKIDPAKLEQRLLALDFSAVKEPSIQSRLVAKRDELLLTLRMIAGRGTRAFSRCASKLYGTPSAADLRVAREIVRLEPENEARTLSAVQLKKFLERHAKVLRRQSNLPCQIRIEPDRPARAAATSRGVTICEGARFSVTDALSLAAHEVGWHVLTSRNSRAQPLQLFRHGTAGALGAQEGGAVLQEELAGALSVTRLRQLAVRCIALDLAVRGKRFSEVFAALKKLPHGMRDDEAYAVCARVFRGGTSTSDGSWVGVFTKDGLYLHHYLQVRAAYEAGDLDLAAFASGKMTLDDVPFVAGEIAAGRLKASRVLPVRPRYEGPRL